MKFILTITLCSFVNNQCLPPVEIKTQYNSWKECAVSALIISKNLLEKQDNKNVNDAKLATKYNCNEQEII